jgi:sulfite oxidase
MTAARLEMMEEKSVPILPITKPLPFDLETDRDWRAEMTARGGRDPEE